jgi:hypothetical protein
MDVVLWKIIPYRIGTHPVRYKSDHLRSCETRVGDPHHFNADPDPAFHQSNGNLRPMVYRPFRAPFLASMPLL